MISWSNEPSHNIPGKMEDKEHFHPIFMSLASFLETKTEQMVFKGNVAHDSRRKLQQNITT